MRDSKKRHRCIEWSFGFCGRGRGWDDLGEWHWNMYLPQVYTCSPSWTPLPVPSLWFVPVHQPQASSIMHWTWAGDSFHIWYYTCFNEEDFFISSCYSLDAIHSDAYIFPFLLCFLLLFFSHLFVRPPQTAILLFCISFPWGWSWSLYAQHQK